MTTGAPMRLYSGPLSMFGMKAHIAMLEKGLAPELVLVPFETAYEPKHPEVLRVNPKRQVPVLIHGDLEIFDSTQIFEYLEDLEPKPALWPRPAAARARARLLELQSDEVYFPPVIRLMGLQNRPGDPVAVQARADAARFCAAMEARLTQQDSEFLCGGSLTYADIAFFMAQLFGERMGARLADDTPRLVAWRTRIARRPAVRAALRPLLQFLLTRARPVPGFLD